MEREVVEKRGGAILTIGDFYPNETPTGEIDPVGVPCTLSATNYFNNLLSSRSLPSFGSISGDYRQ